jgi:phage tail sheath gpL-like
VIEAEDFRNTPGEIAAYMAGILGGAADPSVPWNNVELPSLYLPDPANIPTQAELSSGINGGLFMLSVNENQSRAKIVRAVTTQVSLASAPFYSLLDLTIPRSMIFAARQADIQLRQQFHRAKKNASTIRRARSVVLEVLFSLEDLEILQNVAEHAGELIVETNEFSPDRLDVAIPTSVVPPLNQIVNVINLIVE